MKFGGHETFFLRPGWITKGINLLRESENVVWGSNSASDAMGIGRNMSKSIGWWLNLCGLVHRPARGEALELTQFGKTIFQHDPYLSQLNSWWFIHLAITLCGNESVYSWFFQTNQYDRFSNLILEGSLIGHLEKQGVSIPSLKTIHRDVLVLLQSYATSFPEPSNQDPEDNLDCPLRRLGLLIHRTDLGEYERRFSTVNLPPELVAAALAIVYGRDQSYVDIPLDFVGPVRNVGRVLGCRAEEIAEAVIIASEKLPPEIITIRYLAGQRIAKVRNMSLAEWYQHLSHRLHFDSTITPISALTT